MKEVSALRGRRRRLRDQHADLLNSLESECNPETRVLISVTMESGEHLSKSGASCERRGEYLFTIKNSSLVDLEFNHNHMGN